MITIIDYAINNLRSVEKALQHLRIPVEATSSSERIQSAEKLILPGVGAFADAMANLEAKNLKALIIKKVREGTPLLGVCLGLQLLFSESEEFGHHAGLGLFPGKVRRLPPSVKVPHIGWNQLHIKQSDPLLQNISDGAFVYFVHSYYAEADPAQVLATTDYGMDFPAITRRENIWATQFHPEKSQDVGLQILRNFADL
jgi:imidazole glycerol-phosphate synthase subunit HisH